MPPAVRAGVTPKKNADRDIGAWNAFEITMRGDRLDVVLNGEQVITGAELPGIPAEGPIALQHHGAKKDGVWISPAEPGAVPEYLDQGAALVGLPMRTVVDAVATAVVVAGIVLLFPLGILLIGLPVALVVRLVLEIARRF